MIWSRPNGKTDENDQVNHGNAGYYAQRTKSGVQNDQRQRYGNLQSHRSVVLHPLPSYLLRAGQYDD